MELKLTSPYMHGPSVVRLQEVGDQLGFDYGPNDGVFGPNTERTVRELQKLVGVPVNGVCDDVTWDAIIKFIDRGKEAVTQAAIVLNSNHPKPKLYNKPRGWDSITGITLHQTGCQMPKDPYKWCNLNAHIGITVEGIVVLCNPFTDYIWHAQGLSAKTIGIEIAGNFYGIEGKEATLWKGGGSAAVLNEKQIEAAHRAIEYISQTLTSYGSSVKGIYAHRQSSKSRTGDPGSAIWQKIALPWIEKLGLDAIKMGCFVSGDGRPIPSDWDPRCVSNYW